MSDAFDEPVREPRRRPREPDRPAAGDGRGRRGPQHRRRRGSHRHPARAGPRQRRRALRRPAGPGATTELGQRPYTRQPPHGLDRRHPPRRRRRRARLRRRGRRAAGAGVLWTPPDAEGARPLVLIGHGATAHKRIGYVLALARELVRRHGFAAVAIDGAGHGDRRPNPGDDDMTIFGEFLTEWSREGSTDEAVADWRATLDAVRRCRRWATGRWATGACRWAPSTACPWRRPSAASRWPCSGSWAWWAPPGTAWPPTPAPSPARCCSSSSGTTRSSPGTRPSSSSTPSARVDKRLHASPGEHAAVPAEEFVFSARFLARHLAPGGDDLS